MNHALALLGSTAALMTTTALSTALLTAAPAEAATLVSTELVLSVDVSGSINATEFNLQRQGYANAFRDAGIIDTIRNLKGGIAVTLQYWASQTAASIGWFHVTDAASSFAFADAIEAASRPTSASIGSATNVAAGIRSATALLLTNDFQGDRLVIDVSGDGIQNTGCSSGNCIGTLQAARDEAIAAGITINGLPILNDVANLDQYFAENVIGGSKAFLQAAADFSDFEQAVKAKIQREIAPPPPKGTPEPSALAGFVALGLAGWRAVGRRCHLS